MWVKLVSSSCRAIKHWRLRRFTSCLWFHEASAVLTQQPQQVPHHRDGHPPREHPHAGFQPAEVPLPTPRRGPSSQRKSCGLYVAHTCCIAQSWAVVSNCKINEGKLSLSLRIKSYLFKSSFPFCERFAVQTLTIYVTQSCKILL